MHKIKGLVLLYGHWVDEPEKEIDGYLGAVGVYDTNDDGGGDDNIFFWFDDYDEILGKHEDFFISRYEKYE